MQRDRHKPTPQREKDRHKPTPKAYYIKYYQKKIQNGILNDTGMDLICCACLEWKSVGSCTSTNKIANEKIVKYLIETELSVNSDGKFYVCSTCKASINQDIEPRRAQKEFLGFLCFPKELKEVLKKQCTPRNEKERDDPKQKYLELNRLESYILKPVIPFIRIGHLPRGRYFQVKGELIMISANVIESLKKILPVDQNLVPVAFKKKIEYSGHYLQEYVDKNKVKTYFDWLRKYNHLFESYELDTKLIETHRRL